MKVFYAIWKEDHEDDILLRSHECKPKKECGDSDWWFDMRSKMFKRFWSYHHEEYGNQIVKEEIKGIPLGE
jgi:hypothetical protein